MSNANSRSRFSKAQDDVIASYYPEFVKILGTGREASWKADTAKKIIALPLFANLLTKEEDPVRGTSHAGWEERVRKKFGNHKTQTVKPSASSAQSAGSEKGFFGRPKLSAWMLFGVEQKEAIDAGAQSLATEAGKTNTLPFYQTSKKRLWDALTEDEKVEVAGRALRHHQDADLNQEAFRLSIWQDMQDFAKSGIYGDMTMTLLYGFRTAKGSMFCGSSSVNSIPEGKGFGETPGFSSSTWQAFSAFAEDALPVSVKDETQYDIPVDDEGTPVFPAINMNATALGVVNVFIKRYLEILWMHCRPLDGSFSPEIAAAHYDKTRFVLPVAMERVDSLTPGEIVTLSEFFKGLTDSGPFVFRGDAEEGGDEEPPANEDKGEPKKTAKHRTVESQKADDDGLVVNAVQSGKKGDSIGDGEESVQPAKAKPKGKPKAKKGAGGAKGLKPAKKALAKRAYQPDSTEEPARPSKKTRLAVEPEATTAASEAGGSDAVGGGWLKRARRPAVVFDPSMANVAAANAQAGPRGKPGWSHTSLYFHHRRRDCIRTPRDDYTGVSRSFSRLDFDFYQSPRACELVCFFCSPPRSVRHVLRDVVSTSSPAKTVSLAPTTHDSVDLSAEHAAPRVFRSPALIADAVRRLSLAATDRVVKPLDPHRLQDGDHILPLPLHTECDGKTTLEQEVDGADDFNEECIVATGGRAGAWRVALKKFAEDLLDATPARVSQLNHAIASLVEDGSLCLREACLAPKTPRDNEPASKTKPASKAKPAAKTTGVKAKATVPAKKPTSKPKAAATKAKKARSLVLAVVGKKAAPATKVTAKKPRSALKPRSLLFELCAYLLLAASPLIRSPA
ncbi:hypothetical protein K438DRAFT_1961001 [Mycena galopus ATCC 62051]|nr:hypothetical protein K438DRAFT_1961001 [Mycena galopus ATCC 62051]